MIDNDTPVTGEPLNGDVQICVSREGNYQEVNLNFECVWSEQDRVVFKSYDQAGNIVYVKMTTDIAWEAVMEGKIMTLPVGPPS